MPVYGHEDATSASLKCDEYMYNVEDDDDHHQLTAAAAAAVSMAASSSLDSEEDVYVLLAQKDRDLMLAAEIGQALLEKNEELSRQNEKIAEDFSKKLEELEQEKYHLRRRLEIAEEEFDQRVNELQADVTKLRTTLSENSNAQRLAEKEKSLLIQTLTEQNQRLTQQLKECSKKEISLTSELQMLRDQMSMKRSSLDEHVSHLDTLREEINMMTERKLALEKRLSDLQGEREGLSSTLDESTDRIVMLEKQTMEQEHIIRSHRQAMEDLRATNLSLSERLDSLHRSLSLSPAHGLNNGHHAQQHLGNLSLLNEMELSDSERSISFLTKPRKSGDDFDEDEDIECDNPEFQIHVTSDAFQDLRDEMLSSYTQIKTLCSQLRQRAKQRHKSGDSCDTSSSSSDEVQNAFKSGLLKTVVQEMKGLLHDLLRKEAKGSCLTCGNDVNDRLKLEVQLHKSTENYEKLERRLRQQEEESKRQADEIIDLKGKLSVSETKLKAFEEECATLRDDISNTTLGKDELIKKAWEVRDNAVKRKNNTEIELARSRIDVMQINSQLLESIQQKVELSQQLEQWKIDMQELLEEQMTKKLKAHEGRKKGNHLGLPHNNNNNNTDDKSANDSDASQATTERKLSKLLSVFFQRS